MAFGSVLIASSVLLCCVMVSGDGHRSHLVDRHPPHRHQSAQAGRAQQLPLPLPPPLDADAKTSRSGGPANVIRYNCCDNESSSANGKQGKVLAMNLVTLLTAMVITWH